MLGYLKGIFDTIGNFFIALKDLLLNILGNFYFFLESALLYIPRQLYSLLSDLAFFIADTCNACGLLYIHQQIKAAVDSFHSSISYQSPDLNFDFNFFGCASYISDILGLNAGFQLILCAYTFRFVIRRIPVIG